MTNFPSLSRHARTIKTSGIRVIADLVAQRQGQGLPVYPFHLGEPDFDTPIPIKEAAIHALRIGEVHYSPNAGIPVLRNAIAAKLTDRYNFPLDGADVIVTVGACEALTLAMMACLDPGDEVVVPTPCWPNYLQTPMLVGASTRQIPMHPERGFALDPDLVLGCIGPRTRLIIINSPNNPTGAVAEANVLRELLDGARRQGVWVVVDEIYHDLVYDSAWHGVLEVAQKDDPLIYVNGFSKSYAMTGWRLGYIVAKGEVARIMQRIHQALVTSVASFTQYGALAALEQDTIVKEMLDIYAQRRKRVLSALAAAKLEAPPPRGGFYVFPKIPLGWEEADTFARNILSEHGIAVVPGSVFGEAHTDRFRLCFACSDEVLDRGLSLLVQASRPGLVAGDVI
jgi:aspartate/methionine/tyrosine aminotransferase